MNKLFELMKKAAKEGKNSDRESKEYAAKGDILKEIKELMGDATLDKLKGMKKVTVAADSEEGLKAGLEKAGEVLEAKEMEEEEDEAGEDMISKLKKISDEKKKKEVKSDVLY